MVGKDAPMPERTRYVVALYEIDRCYGGPEEGGWWYGCGELRRVLRVAPCEDAACAVAARANRLMFRLQRGQREMSSMAYDGGRYAAEVFAETAPEFFPKARPAYE
jgi:hypothetical protein